VVAIIDAATKNSLKAPDIDTYFDATTIKIWKINMKDLLNKVEIIGFLVTE
jgi:ATP-dependent DNA helicase RecG